MLKLRLVRIGKKKQPYFRIVAAEQKKAVQGKFIEVIGHYNPINKDLTIDKDRVAYWISKGAQPSDSAAVLFKKDGIADMDKYFDPREKKRKKKKESEEEKPASTPAAENKPKEEAKEVAPAEEVKEEVAEETKEEAPAEEVKEEEK
ncbi:30S ribosomal protein S16 [Patescibacteria group bacterium]|nr:30S ribosomal protein S16 [Patescibacteria group bacterium]